jgi:hypothetical protein
MQPGLFPEDRWLASMAVAVFLLGIGLRLTNLDNVGTRSPDERVYTAQAGVLLDSGVDGIRSLANEFKRDPSRRLFPPPTRIGYTVLLAGAMRVAGNRTEVVGMWLSCIASIVMLALTMRLGWRFFNPWVGLLAGLFLAFLPADLAIARRSWQEAVVSCVGLLLVHFAMAIRAGAGRHVQAALIATGSGFLLVKETAALIYGLCLLWVLWSLTRQRRWRDASILGGSAAAGAIAAIGTLSWAVGGFATVKDIAAELHSAISANPYAIHTQTGPAYQLLLGFWVLSPAVTALALAGLAVALRRASSARHPNSARALAAFTAVFLAIPMILPHWLNLRYVSVVFAPLCLLAALAVVEGIELIRPLLGRFDFSAALVLAAVVLVVSSIADYQRFKRVWVERDTQDLSIRMVLESAG